MRKIMNTMVRVMVIMLVGINTLVPCANGAGLDTDSMKVGKIGKDVVTLQTKLTEAGLYSEAPDGIFGQKTENAVKSFEQDHNLKVDGVADKVVFELLKMANPKISDNNEVQVQGRVLDIVATAYAPGAHDNGKWGNKTHLGTQVRPGVIAVDPKVIPLGTRVYVEFADGRGINAVAEDTGGAIKGNRIDIAMWTVAEAYDFGKQKVKVHILN